jgi:hypothetical protein
LAQNALADTGKLSMIKLSMIMRPCVIVGWGGGTRHKRHPSFRLLKGSTMKYLPIFALSFYAIVNAVVPAHADNVVTRSFWLDAMQTQLPQAFCRDGEYFRKCFKVSAEQCLDAASKATKTCIGKLSEGMPAEFHQPGDGTEWGRKLGDCAGTDYEKSLHDTQIAGCTP